MCTSQHLAFILSPSLSSANLPAEKWECHKYFTSPQKKSRCVSAWLLFEPVDIYAFERLALHKPCLHILIGSSSLLKQERVAPRNIYMRVCVHVGTHIHTQKRITSNENLKANENKASKHGARAEKASFQIYYTRARVLTLLAAALQRPAVGNFHFAIPSRRGSSLACMMNFSTFVPSVFLDARELALKTCCTRFSCLVRAKWWQCFFSGETRKLFSNFFIDVRIALHPTWHTYCVCSKKIVHTFARWRVVEGCSSLYSTFWKWWFRGILSKWKFLIKIRCRS